MDTLAATTAEHPDVAPAEVNTRQQTSGGTPLPGRPRRSVQRRWLWLVVGLVLALTVGGAWLVTRPPAQPAPVATAPVVKLTARGKVQPVQQARVGTLAGGVVARLSASPGDHVADQQEVARVRGPGGTVEVLTAPWAGTVTAVPVNFGDTVMAGATIASIGDLSRLQVETTDVDEYLISKIDRGQSVQLVVDALDGRSLSGVVSRVTLEPQLNSTGDEHYPITITLTETPSDLRAGMSIRATFAQ